MSQLSTFYPAPITAADLGLGPASNATFGSIENTPIGSTTPSTGAFTTLNANGSGSADLVAEFGTAAAGRNHTIQIWGNGAGRNHVIAAATTAGIAFQYAAGGQTCAIGTNTTVTGFRQSSTSAYSWSNNASNAFAGTPDLFLYRDGAAGTLAQRNDTNPQTFNIYNTFTSATNHERLRLGWSSNVAIIGTEKGSGGGTARALEFQTDGVTRASVTTGGNYWVRNQLILGVSVLTRITSPADGVVTLFDSGEASFGRLQFGGTTSSFPALKRSSTALQVRLADDSAFAPLSCGALTLNGNLDASTRDLVTDTTTGTKIGTGTTQKIGFFNATPVVQQAAVADATDAASTQARLNDLLARLRTLGLIAT